jgi:hypothetical protein
MAEKSGKDAKLRLLEALGHLSNWLYTRKRTGNDTEIDAGRRSFFSAPERY